ncbi:GMC family oxidoreductase N-terminal domain-containing protein [Streptomyces sp. NBC_01800]|nr:GMC family oxidoreductase N-terminal domain-containing protein [Streptomyces sp. NBC_01800]
MVAARLSEDSDARVLLLEAGGSQPLEAMAIPPAWPTLLGSSADWADETVPQTTTGLRVPWPRGRGLGGSSSINAMNFRRGHHTSYDSWNEAVWRAGATTIFSRTSSGARISRVSRAVTPRYVGWTDR